MGHPRHPRPGPAQDQRAPLPVAQPPMNPLPELPAAETRELCLRALERMTEREEPDTGKGGITLGLETGLFRPVGAGT